MPFTGIRKTRKIRSGQGGIENQEFGCEDAQCEMRVRHPTGAVTQVLAIGTGSPGDVYLTYPLGHLTSISMTKF